MPVETVISRFADNSTYAIQSSGTSQLWFVSKVQQRRENVLIVLVESMGLLVDEAGRKKEFAVFDNPELLELYKVEAGSVPFHGSTVSGEMRELCHLQTSVLITGSTLEGKRPCLPKQFQDMGYETAGYHCYRGMMFRRAEWYPLIGFEEQRFLDSMPSSHMCNGAFYGACDSDVASLLESRLVSKTASGAAPQFLHWVTLNSHLPVDIDRAPQHPCPIRADRMVCAQLAYVSEVLASVEKLALDPGIGPTAIVIVGDHAPPYLSAEHRELFDRNRVPMIMLTPKDDLVWNHTFLTPGLH